MLLPIPFRTDRPRVRPAYFTVALIVICTLVQVLSRVLGDRPTPEPPGHQGLLIYNYGLWGDQPGALLNWFTHMFIHGDELHLLGNMLFLWVFGSVLEDAIRPWGLALLYVGGGLAAAAAEITIGSLVGRDMHIPMVGASGAVAAVMGLFMVRFHKTQVEMFFWVYFAKITFWLKSVWVLGIWAAVQLLDGVIAAHTGEHAVAYWAHLGGFAAGAAAAPLVGGVAGARKEYVSDDPEVNVEYLRRAEQVAKAEKALAADPGNPYLMQKLAQVQRYAGDYEAATLTYQRAVYRFAMRGMMEQAVPAYLEMIAYNEAAEVTPEVQLKLAQALESSRLTQAVLTYQGLVQRHPTRPEGEHALLRLAALYAHSLGQPDVAARCLADFLHRYPNSQWAGEARQTLDSLQAQLQYR